MLFDEYSLEPLYKLEIGTSWKFFHFLKWQKKIEFKFIIKNARSKVEKDVVNLDKTIIEITTKKNLRLKN